MLGFVPAGFGEVARKLARFRLRRQVKARDRERRDALARLGRAAWEARIDLASYEEWRQPLAQLDAKAGELSATSERLEKERGDVSARRSAEVARFESIMRPAAERRSTADAALKAARAVLAEKEKVLRAADTVATQGAHAGSGKPAGAVAPTMPPPLPGQLDALRGERDARAADVSRLAAESQQCAGEVARIDNERKAALQPLDEQLKRLKQAATGTSRERATVSSEQVQRYAALGIALYDRKAPNPEIATDVGAVAAIDQVRAGLQAALASSAALTAAMPRGTMLRFTGVLFLLPFLLFAVVFGGYLWLAHERLGSPWFTASLSSGRARVAAGRAGDAARDKAVDAFLHAPNDRATQDAAIPVLVQDVLDLGGTGDRRHLPTLARVLRSSHAQLRSAAADAIGMIEATPAEAPALTGALNDPVPAVRGKVLRALRPLGREPGVGALLRRAAHGEDGQAVARSRAANSRGFLGPDPVPDQASLGVAPYPGAAFVYFASDATRGRAAFTTSDPPQKVVEYFAGIGHRPAADGAEFSRAYFGASPSDPTGSARLQADLEAWIKQAAQQGRSSEALEAEVNRVTAEAKDLPLVRYGDTALFGSPLFVALGVAENGGKPRVDRYVVVFEDLALGKTGFVIHRGPGRP